MLEMPGTTGDQAITPGTEILTDIDIPVGVAIVTGEAVAVPIAEVKAIPVGVAIILGTTTTEACVALKAIPVGSTVTLPWKDSFPIAVDID